MLAGGSTLAFARILMPPWGSYKSKPRLTIAHEPVDRAIPNSPLKWFAYDGDSRLDEAYDSEVEAELALAALKLKLEI